MWIDLQGSRSPTRPDLSTPIHPSWPAFTGLPHPPDTQDWAEVMKVHVSNILIPSNAEITRCIKVHDVFPSQSQLGPNHFRCQVKPNIIVNELCYLSITFAKYFILHLKSSILISLGSDVKASTQHSDYRLTCQRAQCSKLEYITGIP